MKTFDDYALRQAAWDKEYRREYDAWIASLPEAERKAMKAAGLASPSVPINGHGSPEVGEDDATYEPNVCDLDSAAEIAAEKFGDLPGPEAAKATAEWIGKQSIAEDRVEIMREVSHGMMAMRSLRPEVLAAVQGASPDSLAEIARRHGVSRSASHKVCVELEKDFAAQGILSHRRQRTPEQRARIAEGVRRAHKRKADAVRLVEEWQKKTPGDLSATRGTPQGSDTKANGVNLPATLEEVHP